MNDSNTSPPRADLESSALCSETQPDVSEAWALIREEAARVRAREERLTLLIDDVFLTRDSLASSVAARLSRKLAREDLGADEISSLLQEIFQAHPALIASMTSDLIAINDRDPACLSLMHPLLHYKGFMAISTYRVSHQLWTNGRRDLAFYFQSLSSEIFGVDIHPAARLGCGIFLDHATSLVIGETSIVEDHVSILHEVTLGGTGKSSGERHPIVRSGVMIGAGSKILGRVEIGQGAKIGAGSVVLDDVAPHKTVAGVPAIVVGTSPSENPASAMDQSLYCSGI